MSVWIAAVIFLLSGGLFFHALKKPKAPEHRALRILQIVLPALAAVASGLYCLRTVIFLAAV